MMCFTEQQKQEIEHIGMFVIEFKRLLIRICKALEEVLLQLADRISKNIQMIRKEYQNMPPKERYKAVSRLDKRGFTEKEINLMVGGAAYHCRNNC